MAGGDRSLSAEGRLHQSETGAGDRTHIWILHTTHHLVSFFPKTHEIEHKKKYVSFSLGLHLDRYINSLLFSLKHALVSDVAFLTTLAKGCNPLPFKSFTLLYLMLLF